MAAKSSGFREKVIQEVEKTPAEYLPNLLALIRIFRESVELKNAEDSFVQGWKEAKNGETRPISELWEGLDDE